MNKQKLHHIEFVSILSLFLVASVYTMSLFFSSINLHIDMMKASVFGESDLSDISNIDKFQGIYSDIDVDSNYYESASYFYNNGLLDGVSEFKDGEFGVNDYILRGDLIAFIGDVFKYDLTSGEYKGCFDDVSGKNEPFICFANINGIVNGIGNRDFAPEAEINLRGFLKVIINSAGADLPDISSLDESLIKGVKLDDWAYPYISYALEHKVITDSDLSNFLNKAVKRGDAMNMIYRLVNSLN